MGRELRPVRPSDPAVPAVPAARPAGAVPRGPGDAVLGEKFYDRPVLAVARDLLGATVRQGPVCLRITEVEAYGGADDPASHAYRGPTGRSRVMFGPPGRAYVYFIYGMHWCFNIVCGPVGTAAAVLIRAGAAETSSMAETPATVVPSASGPGRFARALGVDGGHTGSDLTGAGPVTVHRGSGPEDALVRCGPRVGIRAGTDLPYRLWIAGEVSVSRARPVRPRRPGNS